MTLLKMESSVFLLFFFFLEAFPVLCDNLINCMIKIQGDELNFEKD